MKISVLALALTLAIAGCQQPAAAAAAAVTPVSAKAAPDKPENGAWGVGLANMDTAIKPGDDFYSYVNGKWNQRTEIPADKVEVGGLASLQDKALQQTRALLEAAAADTNAAAGSEVKKLGDWYATYMDEAALDKAGFAPIKPELDAIDALSTHQQLIDLFARSHGGIGLRAITVAVDADRNMVGKMRPSIETSTVVLGAREFYLEPAYAPLRQAQQAHIARMLKLGGFDDAEARARRIQDLETRIARLTLPAAELRDDTKKNNVVTVAELAKMAPGIDWPKYLAATGAGAPDKVIVPTPASLKDMATLVTTHSLEAWKDYLRYTTLVAVAKYLPKPARDEVFAFYGRQLAGQQVPSPRWHDAIFDIGGQGLPLSDPLSKLYVERYVAADARPKAKAMIDNLVAAFDARLANLEWMAPETRAGAREKLAKVSLKAIYPDVWNTTDGLEVVRGDALGNARRAAAFRHKVQMKQLQVYPDRRQFLQPVFLVNAYANTIWNEIVFLAAIVQPPAFDPAADDAVNYGAMGAIIGHEISHLFDDKGRNSDGDGLLRDWWTAQDAQRFTAATRRLQDQVGAYEPLPGKRVNGALTLGESIADLAGLVVAHDAYKRSLGGKQAPVLDGFTGDQRFFLAYGQAWRWKGRDATVDRLLKTDPHPPSAIRPNTVRNVDAWYQAFDVQPGDKLYLKPEDRVRLW
ncbi:MAG: M13 family metallopeptidase [Thermomonas sp.]|uniref:M13 family metallopeptidase n=1 Tax=Thermomonas sp. TaxID=1971895 RepID=UPI00261A1543|nr:M13 family metallopeptidase [Thermomonas sp.]MCC7097143.1 M13 family metallopeptidase [Thermomonas sp.]